MSDLKKQGFTGENIYMGGHSLGGAMSQDWVQKDGGKNIKGLAIMGSTLVSKHRSINKSGKTEWDTKVPTIQINGLKDGLFRITRGAATFWHQENNIDSAQ